MPPMCTPVDLYTPADRYTHLQTYRQPCKPADRTRSLPLQERHLFFDILTALKEAVAQN